jgi:DNA adenine methylase
MIHGLIDRAEETASSVTQPQFLSTHLPTKAQTRNTVVVKPLLKWVGGKRQLMPQIRQFYPVTFGDYLEPFVGSGSVFFDLYSHGLLESRHSLLFDRNSDLIGCYTVVRDDTEAVIRSLKRLATAYRKNPSEHYYRVRDGRFNPGRVRISDPKGLDCQRYSASLAAMLIYLNRTGFNGLFRLNSRGGFNVPLGRYENPLICDAKNLRVVAGALRHNVTLKDDNFETVLTHAKSGDFVYFDPPYMPLSRTARFTSYTAGGFQLEAQERLQQVAIQLAARGCWVLLSNSTAPDITRLYDGNAEATAVGLKAHKVPARRTINSDLSKRGTVMEYLISNIPRRNP